MAATFRPIDALDYSKNMIKRMPAEQIRVAALDQVNKIMWMAAPWRWTIGTMSPIALVSSTQDYVQAEPASYLYLLDGYLADGANPDRALKSVSVLPATNVVVGLPTQYSLDPTTNTLRVFPKPGTLAASPTKYIVPWYKKVAPTLDAETIYTEGALEMDDEWTWVYIQGVLWLCYLYGDDARAGNVQFNLANSSGQYSGQEARFYAGLEFMRQREKLPVTDPRTVPDPLGRETK